jgi:hypothetical protein
MSILSFLKSILKVTDPNNYDNAVNYQILHKDFGLMVTAVDTWKGSSLTKVYLRKDGVKLVQYLSILKFKSLRSIWDKFVDDNKRQPNYIYINVPPEPAVVKPSPIPELETALNGTINDVEDWINLLIKVGVYSHYNCVKYLAALFLQKYGLKVAIHRIRNGGLNCADYVAITIRVFEALKKMGLDISWEIKHVDCNNSHGIPDPNAGHFLLSVTINGVTEDCDPAEAQVVNVD